MHFSVCVRLYLPGLLWNLQTYVDGICPDNLWYFTYTSAPSLLAIRDVVQQQLRTTDSDPFSRLPLGSFVAAKEASNTQYIARSETPQPVPQWLYSAALLPKSALKALYAREQQTESLSEAPFAKQLLKARAFLEALLDKKKDAPSLESCQMPQQADLQWLLRETPAVLQSPTTAGGGESISSQDSHEDTTVPQDALITAGRRLRLPCHQQLRTSPSNRYCCCRPFRRVAECRSSAGGNTSTPSI